VIVSKFFSEKAKFMQFFYGSNYFGKIV